MKKKIIYLIMCIMLTAFAIFTLASLPWTLIYVGGILSKDPPIPEVTYGEFPFKLVYEQDGELIEIEDTLVIEYKGISWDEGQGKHNEWNRYLKSQGVGNYIRQNVILFRGLLENGDSATIFFELGSCEYYMALEEDRIFYWYLDIKPGDIVILTHEYNGTLSEEELYNKYGIKIISKELSPPIKTSDSSSS